MEIIEQENCIIIKLDNKEYLSMTNVGVHPTINKLEKPLIETYIFDFNDDIYSKNIDVKFYKMIREEIKFASIEELKQISNK